MSTPPDQPDHLRVATERIASEDVGGAVARHVAPGAPLAVLAMVCSGWWKGARKLQSSRDYDIVWADHALKRELDRLLRRLPDLEPDLRSPELAAAGGGGHGEHRYDEAMEQLAVVCDTGGVHYEGAPATAATRMIVWDSRLGITSAAIQRMARCDLGGDGHWTDTIPGIPSAPEYMVEQARGDFVKFLFEIMYTARVLTEHELCNDITGMDVARALRIHGRPLPGTSVALSDGFEGRKEYLHTFSQLAREYLQDFMNAYLATTRVADVLLRRAAEEYVSEVVTTARQSAAGPQHSRFLVLKHASAQCFERVMIARHCVHSEPLPRDVCPITLAPPPPSDARFTYCAPGGRQIAYDARALHCMTTWDPVTRLPYSADDLARLERSAGSVAVDMDDMQVDDDAEFIIDDESDDGGPEQQTEQENEDDAYEYSYEDEVIDEFGHFHLDHDKLLRDNVNTSSWWDNIDRSARCQAELQWEDLCECFSAVPPRSWRRFAEETLAAHERRLVNVESER